MRDEADACLQANCCTVYLFLYMVLLSARVMSSDIFPAMEQYSYIVQKRAVNHKHDIKIKINKQIHVSSEYSSPQLGNFT